MTTEEFRGLFPEITDEVVAERQATFNEKKKQSLRDQITDHNNQVATLEQELTSLENPVQG